MESLLSHREITERTTAFVRTELAGAEGGHDGWHIERVRRNALLIAREEKVDLLVVELGALLHDIADQKFHHGDETIGAAKAREFLQSLQVGEATIAHVVAIIDNISFKGGNTTAGFFSPELAVVQDADRLDAIGAIGIARTFNYGGFKGRPLYDPDIPPAMAMTPEQYKASNAPTINHFYEKLLLLKDRLHTSAARRMATERHAFMERFLERFFAEWEGREQ